MREPPAQYPSAAQTAATALCGTGRARLATAAHPGVDVLHARTGDGSPVLLAGAGDVRALEVLATTDGVPARVDVTCYAPLLDLTLPRALLVVTGTVRLAPVSEVPSLLRAHCHAADFGVAFRAWPDARLLVLDVAEVVLHWTYGCAHLDPVDVAAAASDPLARLESSNLARVDAELGGRLVQLVRTMSHAHSGDTPEVSLDGVGAVRAVGLDRYGVVLRCEGARRVGGTAPEVATVRLAFPSPVDDVDGALDEIALLALCASGCSGRCPYA